MSILKSIAVLTVLLFIQCGSKDKSKEIPGGAEAWPCISTFEVKPANKYDTINIVDCHGKKQRHWIEMKYAVLNKQSGAQKIRSQEGFYVDGKKEGYWKNYNDEGRIKDSVLYHNDIIVN